MTLTIGEKQMIELKSEQLRELLESGESVLLDFYTRTCSVCKTLTIQLEEIEERTDVPIIKVDAEVHTDLAERFGIMKVPQLILVKENEEKKRHMGFLPAEAILEMIEEE
jgi:thioredoxin 1